MSAPPRPTPEAKQQTLEDAAETKPVAAPPAGRAGAARLESSDPNARLYPEHWLENIHRMLAEGHRAEAVRSLAEFRRLYPDYRLPDDLRDLR
jgi:hypothetical protein